MMNTICRGTIQRTATACWTDPQINFHDNAVAESFFQPLKRERIRRRTYLTREAASQDVFEHIEMFYNPKRKHTDNGMLSPVDFETRQQKPNEAGI
jgi:putative transposase